MKIVTFEKDPFGGLPANRLDFGMTNLQDSGLDDETRNEAIKAVRLAIRRDVFFLDKLISECESRIEVFPKFANGYRKQIALLTEEMLDRGRC
jgi:hypothetical protein